MTGQIKHPERITLAGGNWNTCSWTRERQQIAADVAAARKALLAARPGDASDEWHRTRWRTARATFRKAALMLNQRIETFNLVVPRKSLRLEPLHIFGEIEEMGF